MIGEVCGGGTCTVCIEDLSPGSIVEIIKGLSVGIVFDTNPCNGTSTNAQSRKQIGLHIQ